VVRRIKADGGEVAKGPNGAPFVERSDGIATILNHPEIVFGRQLHDGIDVKRVAQGVRQHDGFSAIGDRGFQLSYIDVVSWKLNINEDRDKSVLNDRIDGCGKSSSYGDDFVSGREPSIAERRRREARKRREIGRRSGVNERSTAHAHEGGKFAFELSGKAAGGKPSIKRGFDQKFDLGRVKDFARYGYAALAPRERLRSQGDVVVLLHGRADFIAQLTCCFAHVRVISCPHVPSK